MKSRLQKTLGAELALIEVQSAFAGYDEAAFVAAFGKNRGRYLAGVLGRVDRAVVILSEPDAPEWDGKG